MKKVMFVVIVVLIVCGSTVSLYQDSVAAPKDLMLRKVLLQLGCEHHKLDVVSDAVTKASMKTKLSQYLLAVLIYTESSFNFNAISSKGYYGLMQIPHKLLGEKNVHKNVMTGASILEEKLLISKGHLGNAISYYKGKKKKNGNRLAKKQAAIVVKLFKKIMEQNFS